MCCILGIFKVCHSYQQQLFVYTVMLVSSLKIQCEKQEKEDTLLDKQVEDEKHDVRSH